MKPLPKQYEHKEREKHWQEHWVASDVHHFRDDKPRAQTFVIDTPPPTVSGVLHMGHIFSYTQADFVARYQRMSGKDVFYPMGFDDNGLPTERLVEKVKEKKASQYATREEFVAVCREVVQAAEDDFRKLFKSAALSVDWRQEYQTVSDEVRQLSQASFIDLYNKKQAYREFRPTYWDWVDQTAIASAEIEEKEMPGYQVTIPFGLIAKSDWDAGKRPSFADLKKVPVMTTRPELLGACVALMCHPDDKAQFDNMLAVSPLYTAVVPIAFDEKVDKEKGTGFVMCCSWGDDTDKEWIAKYNLGWRPHLDKDGRLRLATLSADTIAFKAGRRGDALVSNITKENCLDVAKAFAAFEKLENAKLIRDIKNENSAKGKAIRMLEAEGLLLPMGEKGETIVPKTQAVKCAERSGTPIEIIPTHQWFVRITDKKEALTAKGAKCTWYPEYMRIRLNQWIEGLKEDWCISRQRFFGIPFPVWYIQEAKPNPGNAEFPYQLNLEAVSNTHVASLGESVNPLAGPPKGYTLVHKQDIGFICKADKEHVYEKGTIRTGQLVMVSPDKDVMDTWATSSISPQLNARGICKDFAVDRKRYEKLFPADIRPQAHEIIRTWAFYTIVKAHLHADDVPWHNLMISGWCLAADKTKMSKSKGNVITPVALIEDKGSDAVRYWASTSRLGTDTAFSEELLKIGRKLVTKLWNASNFAAINLDKIKGTPTTAKEDADKGVINDPLDLWILSRLNQCIKKATQEFERFEYCDARVAIEDFFWNDFCDNYLELAKARAYGEREGNQQSALYAIYHCLETLLRVFAPFVPHITEELYSHIFDDRYAKTGSVHARGTWPDALDYPYDATAEISGMAAVDVLNVIRKAKSEANVSIKFPVKKVEVIAQGKDATWKHLQAILGDLKAAGSADLVAEAEGGELPFMTEKGWFRVNVILAKIEEQKRNPDQKEQEKLEGKVLHGPGNPDLSKHVVKVQVNSLPESLERKK